MAFNQMKSETYHKPSGECKSKPRGDTPTRPRAQLTMLEPLCCGAESSPALWLVQTDRATLESRHCRPQLKINVPLMQRLYSQVYTLQKHVHKCTKKQIREIPNSIICNNPTQEPTQCPSIVTNGGVIQRHSTQQRK